MYAYSLPISLPIIKLKKPNNVKILYIILFNI